LRGLGAEPSATGFRRRFRRRFGEGLGGFGAKPGQVQQGSEEGSGEGLGAEPGQVQRVPGKVAEAKPSEVHLTYGNLAEVFPALGFPACFRKIYKTKTLRLLGIPPKLITTFI